MVENSEGRLGLTTHSAYAFLVKCSLWRKIPFSLRLCESFFFSRPFGLFTRAHRVPARLFFSPMSAMVEDSFCVRVGLWLILSFATVMENPERIESRLPRHDLTIQIIKFSLSNCFKTNVPLSIFLPFIPRGTQGHTETRFFGAKPNRAANKHSL